MNILFAVHSISEDTGGVGRSTTQLVNRLSDLCTINLLSLSRGETDLPLASGVTHQKVPKGPAERFLSGHRFYQSIHKAQTAGSTPFDLYHINGLWLPSMSAVSRYAIRVRKPLVITPRGMLHPAAFATKERKKKVAWLLYQKKLLQFASAFHATSSEEAEIIRSFGFTQPIAIIPNGVELPGAMDTEYGIRDTGKRSLSSEPASGDPVSCIRGEAAPQKTALFLSRINPIKGLPMLIEAWARIRPEGWRLVIAGNDDANHLPELKRQVEALKLKDHVQFTGPVYGEEKRAIYESADFFVLPSYSENFGIAVTESLAHSVPVLATHGAPWQSLESGKCGWWVPVSEEGIESGLRAALAITQKERAEMGGRGRKLVEENYLWPAIAEKMFLFYERLIDKDLQVNGILDFK